MITKTTARPVVTFDATNVVHREAYHVFVRTSTWGKSPVRFILEDNYTDVVSMIATKLLAHYLEAEFTCAN